MANVPNVLEIERLTVSFTRYAGLWRKETVTVADELSLTVQAGEITALFGASGSGKSLLANAVLGLLPEHASVRGTVRYLGEPLDEARLMRLRGREIVYVPQSVAALDPLMRVGAQVRGSARTGSRAERKERQRALFRRFGLDRQVERRFPHELSGGMARRVLVAAAAAAEPRLVIADEPTPGLDPREVQEVLRRFREMADAGSAVLLISHDLEAALTVADQVVVMYAGTVVEQAPAADFADDGAKLRHPYSRALWNALPGNGFTPLAGLQPKPGEPLPGCRFASRCPTATPDCFRRSPQPHSVRGGMVRCWHAT
jgi:peptide/nickel transport system ATP-binding protein